MGEQKRKHRAAIISMALLAGMEARQHVSTASTVRWSGYKVGTKFFTAKVVDASTGDVTFICAETLYQLAVLWLSRHGISYEEVLSANRGIGGRTTPRLHKRRRQRDRFQGKPQGTGVFE